MNSFRWGPVMSTFRWAVSAPEASGLLWHATYSTHVFAAIETTLDSSSARVSIAHENAARVLDQWGNHVRSFPPLAMAMWLGVDSSPYLAAPAPRMFDLSFWYATRGALTAEGMTMLSRHEAFHKRQAQLYTVIVDKSVGPG